MIIALAMTMMVDDDDDGDGDCHDDDDDDRAMTHLAHEAVVYVVGNERFRDAGVARLQRFGGRVSAGVVGVVVVLLEHLGHLGQHQHHLLRLPLDDGPRRKPS